MGASAKPLNDWDMLDLGMSRFQGRAFWRACSGREPSAAEAREALGALDDERGSSQGPMADAALRFARWPPMWIRLAEQSQDGAAWVAKSLALLVLDNPREQIKQANAMAALASLWLAAPQAFPLGAGQALGMGLNGALRHGLDDPDPQFGARREALFARRCVDAARQGLTGPARGEAIECSLALDCALCASADYGPLTQAADLLALEAMQLGGGGKRGRRRL